VGAVEDLVVDLAVGQGVFREGDPADQDERAALGV